MSLAFVLKLCKGHGSAVLCTNSEKNLITEIDVLDEQDFEEYLKLYCNSFLAVI